MTRNIVIGLVVVVGLMILGFIAWITGGSLIAFIAAIGLLILGGAWAAGAAGIADYHGTVRTLAGWAAGLCAIVIFIVALAHWIGVYKARSRVKQLAEIQERLRNLPPPPAPPEYPRTGEGQATRAMPIKAWLDPLKTRTRPSRPARYVFALDTVLVFDDSAGAFVDKSERRKVWWGMPAGRYLVIPLHAKDQEMYFRWY